MGDGQIGGIDESMVEEKDIEIDDAGTIANRLGPSEGDFGLLDGA